MTPVGTWTIRALGWLVALAIMGVFLRNYATGKVASAMQQCMEQSRGGRSALASAQELIDCVWAKGGPLEHWILKDRKAYVSALPYAPCRYIGQWRATRPGAVYDITLKDDSTFMAEPVQPRNADTITGSWGFYRDRLIWFYDNGRIWPPDINPVRHQDDKIFMLTEPDGSTTTYMLLQRFESTACARV
jgi:hypothetical protein